MYQFVLLSALLWPFVLSCAPGSDPVKATEGLFGGSTKLTPMPDGRTGVGIYDYNDVTCTFDSVCRWGNEAKGGNSHWYLANGTPNQYSWTSAFGTSEMPNPPYAIIPLTSTETSPDWFMSDIINCQDPEGYILFKYWVTKSVSFQVCAISTDGANRKIWCSSSITQSSSPPSPGPMQLQIPVKIMEPFRLAFIPSGKSGYVAIDDIGYYAENMCPPTTTAAPTTTPIPTTQAPTTTAKATTASTAKPTTASTAKPTTASTAKPTAATTKDPGAVACASVPCNFEAGSCGYVLNDARGNTAWQLVNNNVPQIGSSQVTKVQPDSRIGSGYMGTNAYSKQKSVAALPPFTLTASKSLSFLYFQGTYGGRLQVCYNSALTDCEIVAADSSQNTLVSRSWRSFTSRSLPAGSYQIYLVGDYNYPSADYAGIAVDNLTLTGC